MRRYCASGLRRSCNPLPRRDVEGHRRHRHPRGTFCSQSQRSGRKRDVTSALRAEVQRLPNTGARLALARLFGYRIDALLLSQVNLSRYACISNLQYCNVSFVPDVVWATVSTSGVYGKIWSLAVPEGCLCGAAAARPGHIVSTGTVNAIQDNKPQLNADWGGFPACYWCIFWSTVRNLLGPVSALEPSGLLEQVLIRTLAQELSSHASRVGSTLAIG